MSDEGHVLEAREVEFAYLPDHPVLRKVSMTASARKLVCILGPHGSGKTTLLRCLLGRLRPSAGAIELDGAPLKSYSSRGLARLIAYVPQTPSSAFAFTVNELVLMGRFAHTGLLGLGSERDLSVAHQAMLMTDTLRFADRALDELSGGEAQRVMIARALAQQPQLALLDEPTSHLDIKNQLAIYRMMWRLGHDWGMALVCVAHDVNLASRFADELVLMRDGEVLAAGTPKQVVTEENISRAYDVQIDLIATQEGAPPIVRAR